VQRRRWTFYEAIIIESGTTAGPTRGSDVTGDFVTRPPWRIDVIHLNRFNFLKKLFINGEGKAAFFKHLIIFSGLIQSHPQRGARSPTLHEHDPDGRC
jgi:hypothetical protein